MKSIVILSVVVTVGLVLTFLPRARCHVIGGSLNTDFTPPKKSLLPARSRFNMLSWERAQEARGDSWERRHHKNKLSAFRNKFGEDEIQDDVDNLINERKAGRMFNTGERAQEASGDSSERRHHKNKLSAFRNKFGEDEIQDDVDDLMYKRKAGRMFNTGDEFKSLNEMWRRKRDVQCSLPRELYKQLQDLNAPKDVHDIFRFSTIENASMPSEESIKCGNDTGYSKLGCTAKVTERDLGSDYFPRYLRDVQCVQTNSSVRCQTIQLEVTVFKKKGCDKGKSVLGTVKIPVSAPVTSNLDGSNSTHTQPPPTKFPDLSIYSNLTCCV